MALRRVPTSKTSPAIQNKAPHAPGILAQVLTDQKLVLVGLQREAAVALVARVGPVGGPAGGARVLGRRRLQRRLEYVSLL